MGRETKVGLLVGMCFIVCFAIILSRRGEGSSDVQSFPFEIATVLSNAPPVGGDALGPRELPASVPIVTRPAPSLPPLPAPTVAPQPPPAQRQRPVQQDSSDVALANAPRSPRDAITTTSQVTTTMIDGERYDRRSSPIPAPQILLDQQFPPTGNRPLIAGDPSDAQPLVLQPPHSIRMTPEPPAVTPEPVRQAPPVEVVQAPEPAPPPVDMLGPPAPRAELARYVVQPGDTLTKIAKHQYGTNKPDVVKALYEANKGVLPNPHTIGVGKELLVPVLDAADAPPLPAALAEVTTTPAAASVEARTDAAPAIQEGPMLPQDDAADRAVAVMGPDIPPSSPTDDAVADASVSDNKASEEDVHLVAAGDTLTRIVRHRYGTDSKAVLDAVVAANRSQLRDKNKVVVGTKLVLPDIKPPASLSAPRSADTSARPSSALVAVTADAETQPETPPAAPRRGSSGSRKSGKSRTGSYEIQRGDTYSTVAAQVLGSSKRWPEIERMNRDIVKDANHMKTGQLIRVPKPDGEDVTTRTRQTR